MFKNFVSLILIAALISAAQITDTLADPATLMAIKKSSRSSRSLNPETIQNSYKILFIGKKIDVHAHSNWAKSVSVETF